VAVTLAYTVNRPAIDTRELKGRADLLALIGRDTRLRKAATTRGGEYEGPCPFRGGRDRLRVQPERGLWWCRRCGGDRWQDAIAYVMRRDGSTFGEACAALGGTAGLPRTARTTPAIATTVATGATDEPSAEWQGRAAAFVAGAEATLWSAVGARARAWLHARGLADETIRRWQLGYQAADAWERSGPVGPGRQEGLAPAGDRDPVAARRSAVAGQGQAARGRPALRLGSGRPSAPVRRRHPART
jgi:DNA primase